MSRESCALHGVWGVQKQCGVTYELKFDEVYWNSRLESEHSRLVKSFGKTDLVCDMMAVG